MFSSLPVLPAMIPFPNVNLPSPATSCHLCPLRGSEGEQAMPSAGRRSVRST